jgi:predicted dehydrogenase
MNRRQFSLSGLSLAAAGYQAGLAAAGSRQANEQLQLGVIGVGNYGATNLAAVKTERVTALCDVDSRYLDEAAARLPGATRYRDLREMLAREDLDAVVISTPDHTHAFAALAAMQRGRHVYCEKPLALTLAELDRMIEVAAAKDRHPGRHAAPRRPWHSAGDSHS